MSASPIDQTPKARWKRVWRAIRVARREALKARMDLLCYGTGIVKTYSDGRDPEHVPVSEWRDWPLATR